MLYFEAVASMFSENSGLSMRRRLCPGDNFITYPLSRANSMALSTVQHPIVATVSRIVEGSKVVLDVFV